MVLLDFLRQDIDTKQLKVYDLTDYVEEHPGGLSILNNAGVDSRLQDVWWHTGSLQADSDWRQGTTVGPEYWHAGHMNIYKNDGVQYQHPGHMNIYKDVV